MAAAGEVLPRALHEWLSDPFFRRAPPRSTGRERFGGPALDAWLSRHGAECPEDLVATLTELTARTIADAYEAVPFAIDEVLLCGGGARNPEIRRRLRACLPGTPVRLLEDATAWDGDAREAAAFALLARQHVLGFAPDLGWATGASAPRILGKRTPA
jgi:anhydro-N-acetylmuramic acid kinase